MIAGIALLLLFADPWNALIEQSVCFFSVAVVLLSYHVICRTRGNLDLCCRVFLCSLVGVSAYFLGK